MRFDLRPGVRRLFRLPTHTSASIHADIDDELESLIAIRVDALIARGMAPDAARAEALRHLGASLDDARRQLHQSADHRERRMRLREHLENLLQDIRYAARGLARRPGFTAVAVLTLAIGIGATTAIFSAVNVLLLRPLPYANPAELMSLSLVTPDRGGRRGFDNMVWSYPKFTMFRDAQREYSEMSLYSAMPFTITGGDVEQARGEYVGATYFRTLGVTPARGVDFDRSIDAHPGAPRQVILSYNLWERRYDADPAIIGHTIDIDREPYAVIGVAPPGFQGLTGEASLFIPVTTRPSVDDLNQAQSHEFLLIARRKPSVSVEQAATAATLLGRRINEAFPDKLVGKAGWGAKAIPLDAARVAPVVKRSILILFGAVAFVLLIACVNVANLLLGRASARRREIAVRLAIGAGRARLVRLLLTESLLLAFVGGCASVVVAMIGVRALSAVDPAVTLRAARSGLGSVTLADVRLDWSALAFTLGVAIAVGLAFGLLPALKATRASLSDALKDGADSRRGAGSRATGRRLLVVAEVALALVLLAGSGLMIRSLTKMLATDSGVDARNVLTLRLTVPPGGLGRDSLPGFYDQLLDRVRAVPGVTDAALIACAPLSGGCNSTLIDFKDRPNIDVANRPTTGVNWASPGLFATLRIPLKRGRLFTNADRIGAPKVVLVSDAAAKKFWPGEEAIGKRVGIGQGGFFDGAEVIGIVGDVRQFADSAPKPDVYLPYLQSPRARMFVFLRTARKPQSLAVEVRRAIHDVAPQYPVNDFRSLTGRTAAATAPARFSAILLGLFAFTALALAAIGIYGVMSLAVAARTREIGIRIALGAEQGRVQRLVIGEGLALVSVGAVIGLAGALLATRVLRTMLFDLTPSDPVTYVAIVCLLGGAAITASWIPARRASRVDPVEALRAE